MVTRTGIEPMLQPWKGRVLTAWPTGQIVVAEVGFEPTTFRVWTERSSQLSYPAMWSEQAFLAWRSDIISQRGELVKPFFEIFLIFFAF